MSLCMPEWDARSGGMLGAVIPSYEYYGKPPAEFVSSRKSHYTSQVPDQDHLDENGLIDMQGQSSKCGKWQYTAWNGVEDGVTPSKPKGDEVVVAAAAAHPPVDNVEDEMVSWLQYPLDAMLERSYCSEFFGELPGSTSIKDSFGHGAARAVRPAENGTSSSRGSAADAAMMMGYGRAAGLLPQSGVEAFSKVRTLHSMPSSSARWPQSHPMTPPKAPMLPPKVQPVAPILISPLGNRPGSMNFSHFSRPAAMVKANLHSLAAGSLQINPPRRPMAEACTSTGSSIAESTAAEREKSNGVEDNSRCVAAAPSTVLSPTKDRSECKNNNDTTPADQETCRQSGVTSDAALASPEKGPDVQEPTITSSSGGYGTSAERPKEAAARTKRKSSEREDAECQSEDGEDESVDTKKPVPGRGGTTKRSRAAEVHNQSERRRRDRINEKMKALQELIPNSNKTDKASMLDEAIEYLKMLQVQLQMMSIRTGMTLPPMVVPSGLQQHMQMPQMGMGMGMVQMGLGMGMMDLGGASAGSGRAVMQQPMPSHAAGPSLNATMASPSPMVDMHDIRYQASGGGPMDSYNAYMARPHQPMQMNQALGMDRYNAYLLQQHQLQQQQQHHQQHQHQHPQHQQQQQQQQHQQHQIHQQPPNMNGAQPH